MEIKEYPHADFLQTMEGIPKYWVENKEEYSEDYITFYNLKTKKDLTINLSLESMGAVHINYGGNGIKVVKTKSQALAYTKQFMRNN